MRVIDLEGDWRVARMRGLLPPMFGVWKRIRGAQGETRLGPLPGIAFRIEEREGGIALIYRAPFSMFIDTLRPGPHGSWVGRTTVCGREFGCFRMSRR
jgi:hypothetical protein